MIHIDTPLSEELIRLVLSLICMFFVSVLVLAKFSFARLREDHIAEMDSLSDKNKEFLTSLYIHPDRYINTAQFLVIFFIISLVALSDSVISQWAAYVLRLTGFDNAFAEGLVNLAAIALISTVVLILGEIIPKALGLSFPDKYIRFSSRLIYSVGKIIFPFIWFSVKLGNIILEPFEAPFRTEVDLVHSEEEIRMMVSRSHQQGAINRIEGELIDNVFDFVGRLVKEVMIPRQDVNCLYVEDSFEETMRIINTTSHTRYPLCVEDKDHIIGLVHIKDLMEHREEARMDLSRIRRDILTVPEVMKLSNLLQLMRTRRIYQAVIVDEYGGMVGLVGLEDIVEELVGDIQDEHETAKPAILPLEEGKYDFDGKVLLDEVEDELGIEFDDADEDTIGGYIFGLLERTPVVGDTVQVKNYEFIVTAVQGYRIVRLLAVPMEIPPEEDEAE